MRRIGLAVTFVLGVIIGARIAEAQQAPTYRIGVLAPANPRSTVFSRAFELRLRELGYEEGRNVAFEYRDAEGKLERLPALASELVRLNVDAIVVATDPATRAAQEATKTIPILIAGVNYDPGDPVALKYDASFARPGGNVTEVFFLFRELTAKRLELFRELLPTVSRVAVLTDSFTTDQLRTVETGNRSLGFKLQPLTLRTPPDFEDSVRIAVRSNAKALFVLESPLIYRARKEIAELALKQRLPTSFAFREYVDVGGLVSYGVSFPEMFRRIAEYVEKILKGAKPGHLPIEQPIRFELVINLKTAKALRLTIPPSVLGRADQVIK